MRLGRDEVRDRCKRPARTTRASTDVVTTVTTVIPTVNDQFQSGTGGWCVGGGNPCDGNAAAGDYGTIDGGIPSRFTNGGFGNYAPDTPALFKTKMALVSGTTQANQGLGCQTPGTEGCTGPYYVPPTAEDVFPSNGFTVTDDIYLDPSASVGNLDEVDPDVGISTNSGAYGQDLWSSPSATRARIRASRSPSATTRPATVPHPR